MDTHFSTYICYNKCLPIESSRVDNVKTDSSYFNSLARSSFKTKNKESRFTIYAYAAKNRRTTEEISQTPNGITSAQLGFYSSLLVSSRLHSAALGFTRLIARAAQRARAARVSRMSRVRAPPPPPARVGARAPAPGNVLHCTPCRSCERHGIPCLL